MIGYILDANNEWINQTTLPWLSTGKTTRTSEGLPCGTVGDVVGNEFILKVSVRENTTTGAGGGLTNTQLRASAVPVRGAEISNVAVEGHYLAMAGISVDPTAPSSFTAARIVPFQFDLNTGGLLVVDRKKTAADDTIRLESHSFTNITTATTTVVKASAGVLRAIIFNKRIAAGVTTIYNNTSAAGAKIGTITVGAAILGDPPEATFYGDLAFTAGLTIVTSAAEDITVVWR